MKENRTVKKTDEYPKSEFNLGALVALVLGLVFLGGVLVFAFAETAKYAPSLAAMQEQY